MTFITIIHVLVCLVLIALVLLQDSKGALGSVYGGGSSSSLLGPTGATNFLAKVTRWMAIIFAGLCIVLSKISAEKQKSVLDNLPAATTSAPVTEPAAPPAPAESAAPSAPEPATK